MVNNCSTLSEAASIGSRCSQRAVRGSYSRAPTWYSPVSGTHSYPYARANRSPTPAHPLELPPTHIPQAPPTDRAQESAHRSVHLEAAAQASADK
jgi:hypothetical protein